MYHAFRVSGFGFRFSGFGFRVPGFGFQFSGFGFRVLDFGFRVPGFGFRNSDFEFRVSGFGGRHVVNGALVRPHLLDHLLARWRHLPPCSTFEALGCGV